MQKAGPRVRILVARVMKGLDGFRTAWRFMGSYK